MLWKRSSAARRHRAVSFLQVAACLSSWPPLLIMTAGTSSVGVQTLLWQLLAALGHDCQLTILLPSCRSRCGSANLLQAAVVSSLT